MSQQVQTRKKSGTMSAIVSLFFAITFLISSLIINFFQLLIYWLVRPYNKDLYRRINYYLIYSSWSQTLGIVEWWGNSYSRVYANEETWNTFAKDHCLILMNHKYEVDWIITWMVADKFKVLGGSKCFAKSSLKKMPIIGWAWIFCEMVFLERNWQKDSQTLGAKLDNLLEYTDTSCLMLLFPEGTRLTPAKYKAGVEFAQTHNLKEMKHHLLPRAKGFNFCAAHLKNKISAIYNIQLAFPKDVNPTTLGIMMGKQMIPDMYINRIPMKDVPTDNEEECSKFLHDLYHTKDELMENYWKTGVFPGECRVLPRRIWGLLNLCFWSAVVGLPMVYYLLRVFFFGSTMTIVITSTLIALVLGVLYFMLGETMAKKGSSYGATSSSTPTKSNPATNSSLPDHHLLDDGKLQPLIEEPETEKPKLNGEITVNNNSTI